MTTETEQKLDALASIDRDELARQLFEHFLERYGARTILEMLMGGLGYEEFGYCLLNALYPRKPLQKKPAEQPHSEDLAA